MQIRYLIYIILLMYSGISVLSQDLIVRTNGDTLKCKIKKTDSTTVFFKVRNHTDFVYTSLKKNQISQIIQDKTGTSSGRLSIGLKAELGMCYYDNFQKYEDEGFKVDKMGPGHLSFGIISDFRINKNLYLGFDFLYDVQRGGSFEQESNFTNTEYSDGKLHEETAYFRRQYLVKSIDIPIYVKFGLSKSRVLYYLSAGIAPSKIKKVVYRSNSFSRLGGITTEDWDETEIKEMQGELSHSYLMGAGIRINFKRVVLNPELRFNRFASNEIIINREKQDSKNYIISASFSLLFH